MGDFEEGLWEAEEEAGGMPLVAGDAVWSFVQQAWFDAYGADAYVQCEKCLADHDFTA